MNGILHWTSLALVVVGSALIVVGFARISYANEGLVKRAGSAVNTAWGKIIRRKSRVETHVASGWGIAHAPSLEFESGPLDPALSDSESIERLWQMLHEHEIHQNQWNRDSFEQGAKDRQASRAAKIELHLEIADIRSELIVGLRKAALEGLGLAASGAVLVAFGDILGAVLAL